MNSIESKVNVICLTPVRNEAWILYQFLSAASIWADYIIVADQMSDDGSRDIIKSFPKVILVDNNSETFNEPERQMLLLAEARKIESPRLIITLDADEFFYPDVINLSEWQFMLNAKPGTVFNFQMQNLMPDLKYYWEADYFPWGYMDDGAELRHVEKMHTSRIPISSKSKILTLHEIKVVHFQFTNWSRMESKHRWYQCFERINYPTKSSIEIYRRYHHMYSIIHSELMPFSQNFINDYKKNFVDFSKSLEDNLTYFDLQLAKLMDDYGSIFFRKLDIWDGQLTHKLSLIERQLIDPRNKLDKLIHNYLKSTQYYFKKRNLFIRIIDKLLSIIY